MTNPTIPMGPVAALVAQALAEDGAHDDRTTLAVVPAGAHCRAALRAKQDGVLSGMPVFRLAMDLAGAQPSAWHAPADGHRFHAGEVIAEFAGNARGVLSGERTALNFVQRLSGVATLTAQFTAALAGTGARICDTRKTTPGLRLLEKAAVRHGGGANHRFGLQDGILIKENHIAAAGGITAAVTAALAQAPHLMRVEVEVRDLAEFDEALAAGAPVILLDNMDLDTTREAVRRAQGRNVLLEASGNVSLERARAIAETGVHYISCGALTHSAPAVDLSLLIEHD